MIAQALRLHQTTVDHPIREFLNKGKLKPEFPLPVAHSGLTI